MQKLKFKQFQTYFIPLVLISPFISQIKWFLSYAPFTEGWWHVYSRLISIGKIPYRDFELLSTPLYPYFVLIFSKVFGEEFYKFRIFGLILQVLMNYVLYKILTKFTKKIHAVLISSISIIFLQNSNAFVNYDYNYLSITFILISLLLILSKNTIGHSDLNIYFAGVSLGLSFLVKQSFATPIIFLVATYLVLEKEILKSAKYLVGFMLPNILVLIYFGINQSGNRYITSIFANASESKGGYGKLLFGWIPRFIVDKESFLTLSFWSVTFLIAIYVLKKSNILGWIIGICFTPIYFLRFISINQEIFQNMLKIIHFLPIIAISLIIIYRIFKKNQNEIIYLNIFSVGLFLGSMLSAGVSELGTFLGLATFLTILVNYINRTTLSVFAHMALLISTIYSINSIKNANPYYWWDYRTPSINVSDAIIESGLQKNLRMNSQDLDVRNSMLKRIGPRKECTNFVQFPHMPFFQLEAGCMEFNYYNLFWPDFTTSGSLKFIDQNIQNFDLILLNNGNMASINLQSKWFSENENNFVGRIGFELKSAGSSQGFDIYNFSYSVQKSDFTLFVK
jgi:hypothetical protein